MEEQDGTLFPQGLRRHRHIIVVGGARLLRLGTQDHFAKDDGGAAMSGCRPSINWNVTSYSHGRCHERESTKRSSRGLTEWSGGTAVFTNFPPSSFVVIVWSNVINGKSHKFECALVGTLMLLREFGKSRTIILGRLRARLCGIFF